MNKKLLSVAIAAALAAPVAMADVQITGTANVGWAYISPDDSAFARQDSANYIADGNSNIVFKGSEDLGNGLKAIWQITTFVDFDGGGAGLAPQLGGSNNGVWGNGNTFLGLASDYGTALLGRHDTPYKISTNGMDLFKDTFADYNNVMGFSDVGAFIGNNAAGLTFDIRPNNVIAYVSPDFSGFSFVGAYVTDENSCPNNANPCYGPVVPVVFGHNFQAFSLEGSYKNGPIFATAAYEKHENIYNISATRSVDEEAWKIGGSYTWGDFAFGGIWESMSSGLDTLWAGLVDPVDHDNWMLNASYTMGNNVFKVQYLNHGDFKGDNLLGVQSGGDMWALGVDHNFSKRTKIYALYGISSNDGNVNTGIDTVGLGTGVNFNSYSTQGGGSVDGFGIGMTHKF